MEGQTDIYIANIEITDKYFTKKGKAKTQKKAKKSKGGEKSKKSKKGKSQKIRKTEKKTKAITFKSMTDKKELFENRFESSFKPKYNLKLIEKS